MKAGLYYIGISNTSIDVITSKEYDEKNLYENSQEYTIVTGPFIAPTKESALNIGLYILNQFMLEKEKDTK